MSETVTEVWFRAEGGEGETKQYRKWTFQRDRGSELSIPRIGGYETPDPRLSDRSQVEVDTDRRKALVVSNSSVT